MKSKWQRRVLLVEDIQDHAEVMLHYLKLLDDIVVDHTDTCEQAVSLSTEKSYDAIISDYMIGNKECFWMLEKLDEAGLKIPIILITGQGNEKVAAKAFTQGVEDYLIKGNVFETPSILLKSLDHILDKSRLQKSLKESEELYRTLVDNLGEGVFIAKEDKFLYLNPAMDRILGLNEENAEELTLYDIFEDSRKSDVQELTLLTRGTGHSTTGEFMLRYVGESREINAEITFKQCIFKGEEALMGTIRDITSRVEAENELKRLVKEKERLSITDDLTGIHNRRHIVSVLESEIQRSRRYDTPLSLIMLDVDRFKSINDVFGHPQGDIALRTVAKVLKKQLRESDIPARFGGDEFLVVLPQTGLEQAYLLAERIRKEVEENPQYIECDEKIAMTLSIGVAEFDEKEDTIGSLSNRVDEMMLKAKKLGRNKAVPEREIRLIQ